MFKQMFVTVVLLFTGGVKLTQLSGPVGIYSVVSESPVKPELENKIHTIFLILLMIFMIFITFNDILRLF